MQYINRLFESGYVDQTICAVLVIILAQLLNSAFVSLADRWALTNLDLIESETEIILNFLGKICNGSKSRSQPFHFL